MARRKSSNPFDQQEDPDVDMSSMIDVGFLLLIYFLVATTLTKSEADVRLALPGTATISGDSVEIDQATIRIGPNSEVYANEALLDGPNAGRDLEKLEEFLTGYVAASKLAGSEPMVILDCDDKAREQRFLDVLNRLAKWKIDNISLTE